MEKSKILTNIKYFLQFITSPIRDDSGKISSIRIVLFFSLYITYDLVQLWKEIVIMEVARTEDRDLLGIVAIGGVVLPTIITALTAKIVQKKMERR